jgi:hypothetical protein
LAKEREPLKHSLINLVRDIKFKAKLSDLLSVKHIVNKFKDKVPSFNKRLRIDEEELKKKEKHANALKISEKEVGSLYNLLNKVLRYNLEKRILTAKIKKYKWFVKDFLYTSETI